MKKIVLALTCALTVAVSCQPVLTPMPPMPTSIASTATAVPPTSAPLPSATHVPPTATLTPTTPPTLPSSPIPFVSNRTAFRKTGQVACNGVARTFIQIGNLVQIGSSRLGAKVISADYSGGALTVDAANGRTMRFRPGNAAEFAIMESESYAANCFWPGMPAGIHDFEPGDLVWVISKNEQDLRGDAPEIIEVLAITGVR